jgi:predicted DNA binding CopG/RHH family protein
MVANALISCRVSAETKARVRQLAQRDGIKESTLIKQVLDAVLRTGASVSAQDLVLPPYGDQRKRVYLRLNSQDHQRLIERAGSRHMAPATYVALLLRAHLHAAAPLPKAEYLALRQSVLELTTIGRNLNQIAKAMNRGGSATVPGRAEVAAMLKVAEGLRDHFRALLKANEMSWRGDGKTSP